MSEAIRIVEIEKELEKYGSVREKVLQLNVIGKFELIVYGAEYILCYYKKYEYEIISGSGGCRFCQEISGYDYKVQLKTENCNIVRYYICKACVDKKLCTYCLREKESCNLTTKKKITFYLSSQKTFPKYIHRFITTLFLKN